MRITKTKIHNYRSIKDCVIDSSKMLVLLGQNNHGKSNILRAVEFALTSSIKPETKDFFHFHMASWVNPDRGEMLFAKKVVFVEGETEKTKDF